ncbi:hypothetical protein QR680_012555 [Steinernema hermaphroditum]|uniref:Uncharacterized protein n=1 Tax=Steinernema hermaphroditum TaxID=289476 RepID=A0AA39M005_9BILA|nr:hypothetical protein QR680_012555 [Steinernema hermaphroditum]
MSEKYKEESKEKPDPHALISGIGAFPMTIPDEVMKFYLEKNGITTVGPQVGRLVALDAKRRLVELLKKSMEIGMKEGTVQPNARVSLTTELLLKATGKPSK